MINQFKSEKYKKNLKNLIDAIETGNIQKTNKQYNETVKELKENIKIFANNNHISISSNWENVAKYAIFTDLQSKVNEKPSGLFEKLKVMLGIGATAKKRINNFIKTPHSFPLYTKNDYFDIYNEYTVSSYKSPNERKKKQKDASGYESGYESSLEEKEPTNAATPRKHSSSESSVKIRKQITHSQTSSSGQDKQDVQKESYRKSQKPKQVPRKRSSDESSQKNKGLSGKNTPAITPRGSREEPIYENAPDTKNPGTRPTVPPKPQYLNNKQSTHKVSEKETDKKPNVVANPMKADGNREANSKVQAMKARFEQNADNNKVTPAVQKRGNRPAVPEKSDFLKHHSQKLEVGKEPGSSPVAQASVNVQGNKPTPPPKPHNLDAKRNQASELLSTADKRELFGGKNELKKNPLNPSSAKSDPKPHASTNPLITHVNVKQIAARFEGSHHKRK